MHASVIRVSAFICLYAAESIDSSEANRVMFTTVRPADYSVPYNVMEKNSVAFSAVEKRSNKFLTVMVRAVGCNNHQ